MTKDLLDVIFDMDRGIVRNLPEGIECCGGGMGFSPTGMKDLNVLYRDIEFEDQDGNDYLLTISTSGEYFGDVPPGCEELICKVLDEQKVIPTTEQISNCPELDPPVSWKS